MTDQVQEDLPLEETPEQEAETPEQTAAPEEAPVSPPQEQLNLDELKVGYLVALSEEGQLVFRLFGKDRGLVELLGLNAHANHRIKKLYDEKQLGEDKIATTLLQGLNLLNQKLDALMVASAPVGPAPSNKL